MNLSYLDSWRLLVNSVIEVNSSINKTIDKPWTEDEKSCLFKEDLSDMELSALLDRSVDSIQSMRNKVINERRSLNVIR